MSDAINEKTKEVEAAELERELPFKRIIPDELPLLFSDNFAVKQQDGMFILYFFQNQYPLSFSDEEVKNIQEIETKCVGRMILTPGQFAKSVKVMMTLLDTFVSKIGTEAAKPSE